MIATSGSSLAAGFSSSFYYNCYCCFDYYCYFPHTFRILGLLHLKKAHRMLLLLLRPLLPSLSCFFLGSSFHVLVFFFFSFPSRKASRLVGLFQLFSFFLKQVTLKESGAYISQARLLTRFGIQRKRSCAASLPPFLSLSTCIFPLLVLYLSLYPCASLLRRKGSRIKNLDCPSFY